MFKREIKINIKSTIIWLITLIFLFLIVFLVYPSIANSNNIKSIDDMMKIFPTELLKAFNMDISSISTAYGWLKTEGFTFVLLIIGCFASILGSTILLKEESDKTIEYLNSLPISRNKIVLNKFIVGIIYIILLTIILGIFNYIGLELSGDFNKKQYILLSLTPILSSLVLYSLSMFISTFTHKTKKMLGISLGLTFLSYILQILSEFSTKVKFLKYFSPFTLSDMRNVILNIEIKPIMCIISLLLTIIFLILTNVRYNKKELI